MGARARAWAGLRRRQGLPSAPVRRGPAPDCFDRTAAPGAAHAWRADAAARADARAAPRDASSAAGRPPSTRHLTHRTSLCPALPYSPSCRSPAGSSHSPSAKRSCSLTSAATGSRASTTSSRWYAKPCARARRMRLSAVEHDSVALTQGPPRACAPAGRGARTPGRPQRAYAQGAAAPQGCNPKCGLYPNPPRCAGRPRARLPKRLSCARRLPFRPQNVLWLTLALNDAPFSAPHPPTHPPPPALLRRHRSSSSRSTSRSAPWHPGRHIGRMCTRCCPG